MCSNGLSCLPAAVSVNRHSGHDHSEDTIQIKRININMKSINQSLLPPHIGWNLEAIRKHKEKEQKAGPWPTELGGRFGEENEST